MKDTLRVYRTILAVAAVVTIISTVLFSMYRTARSEISQREQAAFQSTRTPENVMKGAIATYEEEFQYPADSRPASEMKDCFEKSCYSEPTSVTLGRYTGDFREELVNGSLVIHAGVSLPTTGRYDFIARVYDANGRALAYLHPYGEYAATTTEVTFTVFGKIVRDQNAPSPFHLKKFELIHENDLTHVFERNTSDVTYVTHTYSLDSFSPNVYDSPAKQQYIKMLQEGLDRVK